MSFESEQTVASRLDQRRECREPLSLEPKHRVTGTMLLLSEQTVSKSMSLLPEQKLISTNVALI